MPAGRPRTASVPEIQDAQSFLNALRDPGANLKQRYIADPIGLADRFGIKLPKKPNDVMRDMGIYDPDRHGPITPGLRELVEDVCLGRVVDAVAVGPRGGGKALDISTSIPTPSGWRAMGDLEEGDWVFDEEGRVCTVTRAYPIMENRPCCEVGFSDGTAIVADEDHLWLTKTALDRAAELQHARRRVRPAYGQDWRAQWKPRGDVKTTAEIRDTLTTGTRGDRNHAIDNAKPLRTPKADLPIDPYLFGYWLGDGWSHTGWLSVGKQDVEEFKDRITRRGHVIEAVVLDKGENFRIKVEGLKEDLTRLGVLNDKHVPAIYTRGSIKQRRELLAGLMDSDGTIRNYNNNCQFDSTLYHLALSVSELVASLGWKFTVGKKTAWLNGKNCGPSYRVSFRPTQQVFRLRRKQNLLNLDVAQSTRHTRRIITHVRSVPSVPVRCIEVDSPNSLFLCGRQMVPTHNSFGVSFIEFFLWMLKDYDCLNLGGSEAQANNVYQYLLNFLGSDPYWMSLIKGEPMVSETNTIEKNWIRVLTASPKSVRSPHAGGKKTGRAGSRGGLLVIDEEAEADAEIVEAALYTINTATPGVSVRASTFHNVEGSFQEVVDNHVEMGYTLYGWNVFDVCAPCGCGGGPLECQSEEQCFREDHLEEYVNPDTGNIEQRLLHRAYCGGKAKYGSGWVTIDEITKTWRRTRRSHSGFEVEAMGSRPTVGNHVIKDRNKWVQNIVPDAPGTLYVPGSPVSICVDWGTSEAGLTMWQNQFRGKHVLLHAEAIKDAGVSEIIGKVLGLQRTFSRDVIEIACDIGGGGNYLNKKLREEHRMNVRDVAFAEFKESAAAVWNVFSEGLELIIPAEFTDFLAQVKGWTRKNGRITKGNDHLCDSSLCYFAKFVDDLGLEWIRVPPKSFSTTPVTQTIEQTEALTSQQRAQNAADGRVAVVRTFSRR